MIYIFLLGLILRLSFIIKPEGMWNDEYVSWYVASTPFQEGFWHEVLKQCHMPLYYLLLKPFTGLSDTVMRLTSVAAGVAAIPLMYLIGKEHSKKCAFYSALITSTLSFLVYYSQEIRFYSLLFLFSAMSLLYMIRYLKYKDKKNLILYILSSILILSTHVIGAIYVLFSFLYVMYKRKKISILNVLMIFILFCFLQLPLSLMRMLPASQWWGHFSYTNILFLFSDFFSPILTNHVNAPPVFFYNKSLLLRMLIPTLIASIGLVKGFKKGLGFIAIGTVVTMSVIAICGKLVFITKYAIEILPILILFVALGFIKLKQKGAILLLVLILFHIASFFSPYYVTKIKRTEGHKIVGDILNFQNAQNVIFTYYEPERFYRYAKLEDKKLYYISKSNRFQYMDNPSEILSKIPVGETVSIVFLDSVSFFDEKYLYDNRNNTSIPEMFVMFSNVKTSLLKRLDKDFKDYSVARGGAWTVVKATRFK